MHLPNGARQEEFEIELFERTLAVRTNNTVRLSRAHIEKVLAYLDKQNKVMYADGIIYVI